MRYLSGWLIGLLSISFLGAGLLLASSGGPNTDENDMPQDRPTLWQQIAQAKKDKLPKTEMKLLEAVYLSAVADKSYPEAVKAMCQKITVEASINQPAAPFAIKELIKRADEVPDELKPITNAILANWFHDYFRRNRWRFAQRSQTAGTVSDDFETWDLRRILQEIDGAFTKALAAKEALKTIPIGDYDQLLKKGSVDDTHRPTVFDFVANEAIEFYSLDEQIIRRQGAFDLLADSPVLSGVDEFVAWKPRSEDSESYMLRAVALYQELLSFHKGDEDPTALLDTDLNRLAFANQHASGDEKKARYRASLKRFAQQHAKHALSSRALSMLADSHFSDSEFGLAHQYATTGGKRFPDTYGGKRCLDIIEQVEHPQILVGVENVWNAAKPQFSVQYRNLDRIHFRLVKFDYQAWKFGNYTSPANLDAQLRKRITSLPAVKAWSVDMQPVENFKAREQELDAPLDIAVGSYLLLASSRPDFAAKDNFLKVQHIWKSDLACVQNTSPKRDMRSGQVLHAITGKPVSGARIRVDHWIRDGRNSRMTSAAATTTDADGRYEIAAKRNQITRLIIDHEDQQLGVLCDRYWHSSNSISTSRQTHFFTDRSIYRPGQTIHFKGICTRNDPISNKYAVNPNRSLSVELRDMNNEVVETQSFISNEFGSFSGSFTAPKNRATGSMTLRTDNGAVHLRVEEYKRPKFQVEIDRPEKAYSIDEEIELTGTATAYTGAAIDGAKVSYRVVRSVNYPGWWYGRCWWMPRNNSQQQLVNGTLETETDGSFKIKFKALPDKSADAEGQPVFSYQVFADVTDSAGETRSANRTIKIGFTSLAASLKTEGWLTASDPVEFNLDTTTLDGVPQSAKGKLKIFGLTPPETVERTKFSSAGYGFGQPARNAQPDPDLSKYQQWPTGDVVVEQELETDEKGMVKTEAQLPVGAYKAVFTTTDPNGNNVTAETNLLVIDPAEKKFGVKIPDHFSARKTSWEPGETFEAVWGTGYEQGQAWVEIYHRNKVVKSWWTDADSTALHLKIPIEEKHRGGLNLSVTFVRENRLYTHQHHISVPWSNKKLTVKWEHFVSKLQPGGRETWTAIIAPPQDPSSDGSGDMAKLAAIEMVAAMYDSSLDQFTSHAWQQRLGSFYRDSFYRSPRFANAFGYFNTLSHVRQPRTRAGARYYRKLENALFSHRYARMRMRPSGGFGGGMGGGMGGGGFSAGGEISSDYFRMETQKSVRTLGRATKNAPSGSFGSASKSQDTLGENLDGEAAPADLSKVSIRKNLNETAFFFPNLTTDKDGKVRIEFEVPEALTTWKFMGLAHDAELRTGMLVDEMTTSKDLMVQPNPPRFLREGDRILFPVKVINQSDRPQTGSVQLLLKDGFNDNDLNETFGNGQFEQTFEVPAKESRTYTFEMKVPDFVGAIVYKAVAGNDAVSDGEEGFLPVLSKRILVTESLPLPIRGNQTRTFDFAALAKMDASDSLKNEKLTVQMTSNPSWYAVMALPYLMEYPHQCSEQTFNRLYANALGNHIVKSNDRIGTIFQQWRGTDALLSPLEKNDDLRNVMIAESPWLADGKDESQARRNVGNLFDTNRMQNEIRATSERLSKMQMSDGAWPWFPGGRANDYMTLYITTGYGRLRKMGAQVDIQPAFKAIDRLDWWITRQYEKLKSDGNLNDENVSSTRAFYLYGRTFFLEDKPVAAKYKTAFDYFVGKHRQHWNKLGSRQCQGHVAIAMQRLGDAATATAIMKSLTERSLSDDELGQFWREVRDSWVWMRAPIESQALMIEAYDEILNDQKSVEELKIWLLKQKQTQAWKTTKATADAVYALLLRGKNPLSSTALVSVTIDGNVVKPDQVEAGTGSYQQRFTGGDVKSSMRKIEVSKTDDGIAWGSVHWQYLEDVGKIKPYEGTPLTIKKGLFLKKNSDDGPQIGPLAGPVNVGDELVTRVEIRVDRDMEYVHLKDYRGSGTEPVNVLSRYKRQDGLWYYESTRDTASHFFIDYLPRGTYVFEYSVRVQHQGQYQTGIAEVQCMYAPEFNSHSNSVAIEVVE